MSLIIFINDLNNGKMFLRDISSKQLLLFDAECQIKVSENILSLITQKLNFTNGTSFIQI